MSSDKQRILILGGGFAGVYTAMYLEQKMFGIERQKYEISLVSLENYMVFQPFLPEVISGSIEMMHVITPIRRLAKRTNLYTREIQKIDLERKVVTLGPEFQPKTKELAFDHLVVALGSRLNYDLVPACASTRSRSNTSEMRCGCETRSCKCSKRRTPKRTQSSGNAC